MFQLFWPFRRPLCCLLKLEQLKQQATSNTLIRNLCSFFVCVCVSSFQRLPFSARTNEGSKRKRGKRFQKHLAWKPLTKRTEGSVSIKPRLPRVHVMGSWKKPLLVRWQKRRDASFCGFRGRGEAARAGPRGAGSARRRSPASACRAPTSGAHEACSRGLDALACSPALDFNAFAYPMPCFSLRGLEPRSLAMQSDLRRVGQDVS